jgi:hypothetical protein
MVRRPGPPARCLLDRSTLAPISVLISLAASALRCARLRTSPATTAKPRPCSPARAASTAAFSARMLVWKAMPSITPMMSAILRELSLMPFIVCTTWPTTSPPAPPRVARACASWLAWRALSALWRTVVPSSSIVAAVCCSALACCSVRWLRSWLPWAIFFDGLLGVSHGGLRVGDLLRAGVADRIEQGHAGVHLELLDLRELLHRHDAIVVHRAKGVVARLDAPQPEGSDAQQQQRQQHGDQVDAGGDLEAVHGGVLCSGSMFSVRWRRRRREGRRRPAAAASGRPRWPGPAGRRPSGRFPAAAPGAARPAPGRPRR